MAKRNKRQYLFRKDRVEQKKKEGWRVIETGVGRNGELVLMEK